MKVTRIRKILYVCGACGLVYSADKKAINEPCPDCLSRDILNLTTHDGRLIKEWGRAYPLTCKGILKDL